MRYIDLTKAFLEEANMIDSPEMPTTSEIEHWLNTGVDKFIKTRYSGLNSKQQGFEQSQKRTDDIRTLVVSSNISVDQLTDYVADDTYPYFKIDLPSDYMFHISDTVGIKPVDTNTCWPTNSQGGYITKYGSAIEATADTLVNILNNSLSEYHLNHCTAKPVRIIRLNEVNLYTDNSYIIDEYRITYIRKPLVIDLMTSPTADYTDMPEHTHTEIVKLAVEMYLENKNNPRVQTYPQEVATME